MEKQKIKTDYFLKIVRTVTKQILQDKGSI